MTKLKQQLVQMYTAKQEELTVVMEEFLGRVVESAAGSGIDMRTININTEELLDEGIGYDAFVKLLEDNNITFTTSGDYILIDLEG